MSNDKIDLASLFYLDENHWRFKALCRGEDTNLFFLPRGDPSRVARSICERCPVRAECLNEALTNKEFAGVWGGMDEKERRSLARKMGMGTIPRPPPDYP